MRFKVGELVISKIKVTEEACGDHPAFLLAEKGQRLMVRNKYHAKIIQNTVLIATLFKMNFASMVSFLWTVQS